MNFNFRFADIQNSFPTPKSAVVKVKVNEKLKKLYLKNIPPPHKLISQYYILRNQIIHKNNRLETLGMSQYRKKSNG
jgi:hypothetical protein